MPSLEEDITRIAKLRGRDAAPILARAAERRPISRLVNNQCLSMLFTMDGDVKADMATFDSLPEASRVFIYGSTKPISARGWAAVLDIVGWREGELIAFMGERN